MVDNLGCPPVGTCWWPGPTPYDTLALRRRAWSYPRLAHLPWALGGRPGECQESPPPAWQRVVVIVSISSEVREFVRRCWLGSVLLASGSCAGVRHDPLGLTTIYLDIPPAGGGAAAVQLLLLVRRGAGGCECTADMTTSPYISPLPSPRSPNSPVSPGRCVKVKKNPFSNPDMPGYVGFANLPNQIHRKSVKRGFEFTLMVVGESGLGKSTLINTLFLTDLYPDRIVSSAQENIEKTVKIDVSTVEIEERGVKVRLTVVDTPGYGDAIDNTDCFQSIIQYINDQFERYLQDESGLNRRHIVDNRVHCCFYFINPAGHGLKPLDIQFMKQLHNKVNIVPVLAKADTLTKNEVAKLKRKVLDEIEENGIHIYPLPDCDTDEEEDYKEQVRQLKEAVPFAVVGSTTVLDVGGKKVRGRQYPWGVIEVENPSHCDFIKLRCLLGTHMQDLTEVTQDVHYENYRSERLAKGGGSPLAAAATAAATINSNSHSNANSLPSKKQINSTPVLGPEKDRMAIELEEKEAQIRKMQEMMAKMQAQLQDKK